MSHVTGLSHAGIPSTGQKMPVSSIGGIATMAMDAMACSERLAKLDSIMPRLKLMTASTPMTRKASNMLPSHAIPNP